MDNTNLVQGHEFVVNDVGDPCSICRRAGGNIPIQDDCDVTYWICDACDFSIEWS